jgi:hypothetical protein
MFIRNLYEGFAVTDNDHFFFRVHKNFLYEIALPTCLNHKHDDDRFSLYTIESIKKNLPRPEIPAFAENLPYRKQLHNLPQSEPRYDNIQWYVAKVINNGFHNLLQLILQNNDLIDLELKQYLNLFFAKQTDINDVMSNKALLLYFELYAWFDPKEFFKIYQTFYNLEPFLYKENQDGQQPEVKEFRLLLFGYYSLDKTLPLAAKLNGLNSDICTMTATLLGFKADAAEGRKDTSGYLESLFQSGGKCSTELNLLRSIHAAFQLERT